MKILVFLILSIFFGPVAMAQTVTPLDGTQIDLAPFHYQKRPVIIFADSADDPAYRQQMKMLLQDEAALAERDIVVITDTNPAANGPLRQKLRPHGFMLVLMDKDLQPIIRKPLPWSLREITRSIDKFPLRRQEIMGR